MCTSCRSSVCACVCVCTYVLWSHGKDVGTFQNLDLLALRVCRYRRGGVHMRLPGSARHPGAAFLHTPAESSDSVLTNDSTYCSLQSSSHLAPYVRQLRKGVEKGEHHASL